MAHMAFTGCLGARAAMRKSTCTSAAAVCLVLVLALHTPSQAVAAVTSPGTAAPALCAYRTPAPVGFFKGQVLGLLKGVTLEQCAEACQKKHTAPADRKPPGKPLCRAFQYDSGRQICGLKKVCVDDCVRTDVRAR